MAQVARSLDRVPAITALAVALLIAQAATSFRLGAATPRFRPVAVASADDQLVILNKNGEVWIVPRGDASRARQLGRMGNVDPIDLSATGSAGNVVAVVSSYRRDGSGNAIGDLMLLPQKIRLQEFGTVLAGTATRSSSDASLTGFVATSGGREVKRWRLVGNRLQMESFETLPSTVSNLGPLALDPAGTTLYVAALNEGEIWRVPAAGGSPRRFASELGDIRAIASDGGRLFVLDEKAIVVFPTATPGTGQKNPKLAEGRVLKVPALRDPLGLAIAPANNLWIGDIQAGAVFEVSRLDGHVVREIR